MSIKIIYSHKSIDIPQRVNNHDKKLLEYMSIDKGLLNEVGVARMSLNIPPIGFNIKRLDLPFPENVDFKGVLNFANAQSLLYLEQPLPYYWIQTFARLILFNVLIPPSKDEYPPIEIIKHKHLGRSKLEISITERVTKEDPRSFITNIVDFENLVSYLPTTKIRGIGTKTLKIERTRRRMKSSGKSNDEVLDILQRQKLTKSDNYSYLRTVSKTYKDTVKNNKNKLTYKQMLKLITMNPKR